MNFVNDVFKHLADESCCVGIGQHISAYCLGDIRERIESFSHCL